MKIIGTWSSPFVRKVRIAAMERQIACEFAVDAPLSEQTKVPLSNPLGRVPVLVLDDGTALIDSPLICAHLEELSAPGPSLFPADRGQRSALLQWQAVADGIADAAVLARMEVIRPEALRSASWIERQKGKISRALGWMEERLDGRPFCIGEAFSLADIAMGCSVSYLRFRFAEDASEGQFPNVGRVCEQIERRESFRATQLRA